MQLIINSIVLSLILSTYLLLLIILVWNWTKIPVFNTFSSTNPKKKVSVIIPVRNEEKTILFLLQDLLDQDFPKEYLEILIINDDSTDQTASTVHTFIETNQLSHFKLIDFIPTEKTIAFKKKSIELGVKFATGEIIITTDGDCRVKNEWIRSLHDFIQKKDAYFISAPVELIQKKNIFYQFQQIELAALIAVGAVCIEKKIPSMCNGANMAYLKKIFIEVNGYEGVDHTPSGDDEFLMHKILKKYPEKVFFLKSIDAVVSTHANTTWKQLIHQRKRWAGKWKLYEDTRTKILGLVLAFVSLSFIASIILTALGLFSISVFTWTLIAKIVIESAVISTLLSFFGKRVSFFSQIVFSIIYPFYIIFLGISANIGKFEWKDRTLSS